MNLPSLNLGGSASASVGAGAGASAAGRAAALARLSPAASPAAGPKPAGAGAPRPDPVIGLNFDLKVEDGAFKLGTFTACEGLGAEYEIMSSEEGGENGVVHQLPGRKKYTNVKLTRPL